MLRNFKVVLIALAILVIAGSAYAFAASNSIEASRVGSGTSTVSGYAVTGITYNFVSGDPTKVDGIEFDLDAAANTVKIQLDATALSGDTDWDWATCSNTSGNHWSCTPTNPATYWDTTSIKDLNVAASS